MVNNIQHVCFHDGPGIRTTVFLNSCLLRCPWCANPETSFYKKKYYVNERCVLENNKCAYNLNCNGKFSDSITLENNYHNCPVDAIINNSKEYSIDELENIILEDRFLYKENGGVTFSGGEPLLQSKALSQLFVKLKDNKINIAIETCLYTNISNLKDIIDYVDLFIIDIKILDVVENSKVIKGNLDDYINNLSYIFDNKKNVIFRIPLIKPYITNQDNINKIIDLLGNYKPMKVEVFKGHNLAKEKYLRLGLPYNTVETIDDMEIMKIKERIEDLGIDVEVISF